jgi:hypothetical protein
MFNDLSNATVVHVNQDGVEYIQFRKLLEYEDKLAHCFTTKVAGDGKELNLLLNQEVNREERIENYKKICSTIGVDYKDLVFSNQIHQDTIRHIDLTNRGEGITKARIENGCDGMITDSNDIALITFYADCVALLFYDPVKNVAAMSHAGWRGTVRKIGAKTVKTMNESYGCEAKDIIACIAPSIGPCCFEVDELVVDEFKKVFSFWEKLIEPSKNDKSKINLWKANSMQLIEVGLKEENIQVSGLCTVCNNNVFYSYRADKGKTGRMGAIMKLKK